MPNRPVAALRAAPELKRLPLAPAVSADGLVEGYASLFGVVDLGRDRVERGAFARSIAARGARGVRFLFQHDPAEPIGAWTSLSEDVRGLRVAGRLNLAVARARELHALLRQGALDGLSIGFRPVRALREPGGVRRLVEIDLWEISVVTFPMLPDARVSAVKRSAAAVSSRMASVGETRRTFTSPRRGEVGAGAPGEGARPSPEFVRPLTRAASPRDLSPQGRGEGRRETSTQRSRPGLEPGPRRASVGQKSAGRPRRFLTPRRLGVPALRRDASVALPLPPPQRGLSPGGDLMTMPELRSPETKAAEGAPSSLEVVTAFDDFMRAFEAFKEVNDERLAEIEARITPDAATVEKLARLDDALDRQQRVLDDLSLKRSRPPLETAGARDQGPTREHKAAFEAYARRGEAGSLKGLESKALVAAADAQGGYLVPEAIEREIGRRLAEVSPIRAIATVQQVSASVYRKPFATEGFAAGWAAETAARTQSATPNLDEIAVPAMELFAMPAATQTLLDDAAVDLGQWMAQEVETAFAEQEGQAFVSGDGTTRPQGFLTPAKVANASWSWGKIGYVATGVAGGFAADDPSDALLDLVYAVRAGYRRNASFVMNRRTQASVRKLKDADGRYLWEPPATGGAPATLMGFPLVEAEAMPDVADGAHAIAFGDFRRGYLVVDRIGVRVLRDPFTAKPYVLFYTTKRVGGGVQDFEAIKTLKFSAS